MNLILIAIFFILIFIVISSANLTQKLLLREKILISLIFFSATTLGVTEVLNLFKQVDLLWISSTWALIDISLLLLIFKTGVKNLKFQRKINLNLDKESRLMIGTIIAILMTTFILAVAVAPTNIDAMANQLGRLPHWIQNQSIEFYPTNLSWQINNGILTSSIQLHLFLLSGGDYFANLVQWFFFIGNLMLVSLVAKLFGLNFKGQLTSSFLFSTIPMAILQASTVQDPLLISFFLLSFIYFAMEFLSSKNLLLLFLSGVCLGLSFATKQTAYFYALPFFAWVFILYLKRFKLKKTIFNFATISFIAVAINFPFYLRNFIFSGSPLFVIRDDYINSPINLATFAATTIKNLAINMSTPLPPVNYEIHRILTDIMNFLNLPENGANVNWVNAHFRLPAFIPSEFNTTPNTIHFLLIITASVFIFRERKQLLKGYFVCVVLGFLLFSAVFKWQEAGSHLLFALLPISVPLVTFAFVRWSRLVRLSIISVLIVSSFYFLFFNIHKPIIPYAPTLVLSQSEKQTFSIYSPPNSYKSPFTLSRNEQYFETRKVLYKPYLKIGEFVKKGGYKNIGVIFTEYYSDYEYPLWIILKEENKDIRIEHIEVTNTTARLSKEFKPDAVIFLGTDKSVIKNYIEQKIPVIGI